MPQYQQKNFHTVTPYVYGRPDLMDFLKEVFGAEETHRGSDPDKFHGEVKIGDSRIMVGVGKIVPPEFAPVAQWGRSVEQTAPPPCTLYVYVPDVDAAYRKALALGATPLARPSEQPWKDRMAGVRDAYGNCWWMATFIGEDASP